MTFFASLIYAILNGIVPLVIQSILAALIGGSGTTM